jgi:hypothetical protein
MRSLSFWVLPITLVFLRAVDIAITFAVSPDLRAEINPLVSVAGFGWPAILTANLLGVTLILIFYFHSEKKTSYFFPMASGYTGREFVSQYLFGEPDTFHKIYYVVPRNRRAILDYCGFVFMRTVTTWSLVVVSSNILFWFSAGFREMLSDLKIWLGIYIFLVAATVYFSVSFFRIRYREYLELQSPLTP